MELRMIETRCFREGATAISLLLTGACAVGVDALPQDADVRAELEQEAGAPELDAGESPEEEDANHLTGDESDAGMAADARVSGRDAGSLDASGDAEREAGALDANPEDAGAETGTVDAAPAYSCPSCMLKVQWNTSTVTASTQSIAGYLKLTNTGQSAIPLAGVTVRYWLREAMAESMVVECYHWDDGTGANKCTRPSGAATNVYTNLSVRIGSGAGDLRYVELSFPASAGELAANGSAPGALQLALHLPSYAAMTQSDDPSFDAALTASSTSMLFDAPKISAYLGGKLAWGTEP
jgi:hypothetical protein